MKNTLTNVKFISVDTTFRTWVSNMSKLELGSKVEVIRKLVDQYMEVVKERFRGYDVTYDVFVGDGVTTVVIDIVKKKTIDEILEECKGLPRSKFDECILHTISEFNAENMLASIEFETGLYEVESYTIECDGADFDMGRDCEAGGTIHIRIKSTHPHDVERALNDLDTIIDKILDAGLEL